MEVSGRRYQSLRESMVKNQIEARGIWNPKILAALRTVPRHEFVNESLMDQAYSDHPLPIGDQQTISQPYIVALMTEVLQPESDDRVLEIGTGSGYQAAVLAEIAYRVYTIERNRTLFEKSRKTLEKLGYYNVISRYGDGTLGWKEEGPFDAIMVTAGAPDIPLPLLDQLDIGGRMVIPVGSTASQTLIKLYKDENGVHETVLGDCRFVKLIGQRGWKAE